MSFGRHHQFESQQAVQEELTFVVQVFGRQGAFLPSFTNLNNTQNIPFMALDGLGKRKLVAEGRSELSGDYIVEEVETDGTLLRRLYFLSNPFLIQSEVIMKEEDGKCIVDSSKVAFEYHKAGESPPSIDQFPLQTSHI